MDLHNKSIVTASNGASLLLLLLLLLLLALPSVVALFMRHYVTILPEKHSSLARFNVKPKGWLPPPPTSCCCCCCCGGVECVCGVYGFSPTRTEAEDLEICK
uniref:Uncharacterized protein n=1 Tax=Anopheles darlingi TaxID=43151 RepID=A0A2M4DSI2_ANODA